MISWEAGKHLLITQRTLNPNSGHFSLGQSSFRMLRLTSSVISSPRQYHKGHFLSSMPLVLHSDCEPQRSSPWGVLETVMGREVAARASQLTSAPEALGRNKMHTMQHWVPEQSQDFLMERQMWVIDLILGCSSVNTNPEFFSKAAT